MPVIPSKRGNIDEMGRTGQGFTQRMPKIQVGRRGNEMIGSKGPDLTPEMLKSHIELKEGSDEKKGVSLDANCPMSMLEGGGLKRWEERGEG